MMRPVSSGMAVLCVFAGLSPVHADVTFRSLLDEMTDLDGLTRFPAPAYTCKQFSSYDRRSTDPNALTDENWFANHDRGHHLRVEERNGEKEWVMMDAEGPGAIVRIWSANPKDAGILRIYVDHQPRPVVEMPFEDMLRGDVWPFVEPIAHTRAAGWNSYLPIPYATHCKVTASQPDFYYHINYRTYEPGTEVQTYTDLGARDVASRIREAADRLAKPHEASTAQAVTTQGILFDDLLVPGGSVSKQFRGPASFRRIELSISAEDREKALRGCLLEIGFDNEAGPCVLAPIGDFFGTAPGPNRYASLPSGVLEDGTMYADWVMPFRESASIRITNHSDLEVRIKGDTATGHYEWDDRSMYFHAVWRGEYPIPTLPRQDWTYLRCEGKGVFVGNMLHVTNPVKDWWGEGDEKIYVDGEAFPSHFGTGTEDYYGYAWGSSEVFTHAYHNQPRCDGPQSYGHTCVSRFHILDNIPFTRDFRFDMEVWHWAKCEIAMAATSYWYALPGAKHTAHSIDPARLTVIAPPPLPEPKRIEDALEGESLKIVSVSGGRTQVQENDGWGWSGDKQVWWTDPNPGDRLVLEFPSEAAGRHEVSAVFTKAPDYGLAQIRINGVPAGGPMDFYHETVVATPLTSLGVFDLQEGANQFTVEIMGHNEKAIPRRMFGLDCIVVKPAQ